MEITIATPSEIPILSKLSVSLGNIPFIGGQCAASLLKENGEIVGFAAVQYARHAAGSWVKDRYRGQGKTYELRRLLEDEMRRNGISVYFSIPSNIFEKELFAKYGATEEKLAQVRYL